MPYPNGEIIAIKRVQTFIGKWLANNFAVVIRHAGVSRPLHAAIVSHVCKLIADWLAVPLWCAPASLANF